MKRRTVWRGFALAVLVVVLLGGAFFGYLNRSRPGLNASANGLALSGYDPVSYFPEGGGDPVAGAPAWVAEHAGLRYRFASEENRARFLASPDRYEPAFGGWCTYAVANGYKFEVDPESFLIEDGRLLLFYRGLLGDARAEFEKKGVAEGLKRASSNWPALSGD